MAAPARPAALGDWVARTLADDPPRATSLVVTVFGDAIAPHGGAVWLGGLIELLRAFDLSERLVRTSVFRLGEDGWLESRREGRRSLYALTEAGRRRLAHAYRRVYAPPPDDWDGVWTLLLLDRAAPASGARGTLRRELEWEGFAAVAPGVYAHPRADRASLDDVLRAADAHARTVVLAAREDSVLAARPAGELVGQCWRLDALGEAYAAFVDRTASLAATLDAGAPLDPREAFAARTLVVHAYRRIVLDDPRLPRTMLPAEWPGSTAFALCRSLYARLLAPAERFLAATLRGPAGALPPADAGLRARFGGM